MHINHNHFEIATMKHNTQTNYKTPNPLPKGKSQISTNSVSLNGDGTVNFSSYVENNDFLDNLTQDEGINANPDPHQDSQESGSESNSGDDSSASTSDSKKETAVVHLLAETPTKTNDKAMKLSLRKSLTATDHGTTVPIITPQTKTVAKTLTTRKNELPRTVLTLQDHNGSDPTETTYFSAIPYSNPTQDLSNKKVKSYYSSPFLGKEFKPASDSFDLGLDLDVLKPLIMSQHEVFVQPIKDLGNTNLFLTKIIEKKKQSLALLENEQKIPRSLRIKCELTTSPSYASNEDFIRLKEEMQDTVACFIKKGTQIMTEWAKVNIKLLTYDRCANFLSQAINILEGLSSFYQEIIGTPKWKSLPSDKYIPLFLFKLYFAGEYISVDSLVKYLDTPLKKILFIGTKQLTDATTEEEFELILDTINFADIDPEDPIQESFITETLTSFDQIVQATTIEVWTHYKDRVKNTTAAQNLKARMKSKEATSITAATALAIAKATDNIDAANSQQLTSILRISNLEKSVKRQDQKSNEILNKLKAKRLQKNSNGGYKKGSVISSAAQTLGSGNGKQQKVIDLSTEDTEQTEYPPLPMHHLYKPEDLDSFSHHRPKRQIKNKIQNTHSNKTIQWADSIPTYINQIYPTGFQNSQMLQPPAFQPAPAPAFPHQHQHPYYSYHGLTPFIPNLQPHVPLPQNQQLVPGSFFQPKPQLQNFQQGNTNPFINSNQGKAISSRENPFGTMAAQNRN